MAAYVIVDVGITKPEEAEAFHKYAEETIMLLAERGITVEAFDPSPKTIEGDWQPRMVVIQKYPDMKTVDEFYHCEAYKPLKELRQSISDAKVIAVNGIDE